MAHILVIDDDDLLRDFVAQLLRRAGYDVTALGDSTKADAEMQRGRFDAVLTDLYMPGRDGIEILGIVSQLAPETPVIVMTGSRDGPSTRLLMLLGAFAVLQKPFATTVLLATVQSALAGRRACLPYSGFGS